MGLATKAVDQDSGPVPSCAETLSDLAFTKSECKQQADGFSCGYHVIWTIARLVLEREHLELSVSVDTMIQVFSHFLGHNQDAAPLDLESLVPTKNAMQNIDSSFKPAFSQKTKLTALKLRHMSSSYHIVRKQYHRLPTLTSSRHQSSSVLSKRSGHKRPWARSTGLGPGNESFVLQGLDTSWQKYVKLVGESNIGDAAVRLHQHNEEKKQLSEALLQSKTRLRDLKNQEKEAVLTQFMRDAGSLEGGKDIEDHVWDQVILRANTARVDMEGRNRSQERLSLADVRDARIQEQAKVREAERTLGDLEPQTCGLEEEVKRQEVIMSISEGLGWLVMHSKS
ncbi:hypothetical protein CGRA01v4_15078 [Colletotrichum graminicola]|uniref:Uncharacterized protein n=1 Tax=Colletotrichum graminicola (strain M1.001 / M2 / FGSC 10212) TaxID=645133 RepID=E3R0H5_COLGM|nr:uncharacterized protein GLRG_11758 [Colletotrichum graminicola M1.001]EFQ36613.1 hypothetical protein GLRG_11758 [Colletotrichum graminicola M1.001]WDK23786.1 hypothetical protein CGRA01v4_15078 [Colletotrichum graminicola]